jgi:hypothetical protein
MLLVKLLCAIRFKEEVHGSICISLRVFSVCALCIVHETCAKDDDARPAMLHAQYLFFRCSKAQLENETSFPLARDLRIVFFFYQGLALLLACVASLVAGQVQNAVNYRGQPQADLTCTQQAGIDSSGATVVFRNDPSTNCFGFPSIQFDSLPVEGGKPNGLTIDWSLMVDELQMQDDDRLHIHLPGFTGALATKPHVHVHLDARIYIYI